jgi:hypothetical protein
MNMGRCIWLAVAGLLLPLALAGCAVYEDDHHHHHHQEAPPSSYAEPAPEPAPPSSVVPPPPASSTPLLVEVDTGQTMSAAPGEGVGVFVEYASGGLWYVWWTCDTLASGQECAWDVRVAAKSGTIRNVDASSLPGGYVTTPNETTLEASATTTTELHGIHFETDPGAVISVTASLDGQASGAYLFFVQGGQVNGGYEGTLTNPLEFQGSTP